MQVDVQACCLKLAHRKPRVGFVMVGSRRFCGQKTFLHFLCEQVRFFH